MKILLNIFLSHIRNKYIFIIISNVIPLVLYFTQNWSIQDYLMYFWIESVIIGLFYIIKSIACKTKGDLFSYVFSFLFYLFIHLILLVLVIQFGVNSGRAFDYSYLLALIQDSYIHGWASTILPITLIYLYDFIYNFLPNKEKSAERINPLSYMNGRSIVLLLFSMPFSMLLSMSNSPWVAVLMTVLIRMLYDLDAEMINNEIPKKTISINSAAGFMVNFFLLIFSIMFIYALFNNPRLIDLIASAIMFAFIFWFKRIVR